MMRELLLITLGLSADEQDRHQEALQAYRRAVQIDPDYLNAWKKLAQTAESIEGASSEWEEAMLAMLRLAPARSGYFQGRSFANLRKLWDTILAVEQATPKPESGLFYLLPGARARLEKVLNGRSLEEFTAHYEMGQNARFRNMLLETALINDTMNLVESLRND